MTLPGWTLLLVRASIEGGLLVLAVLAVTRLVPRMPAAARCALWWLASLRLLSGLAVLAPLIVTLPALPAVPPSTASLARASLEAATLHSPIGEAIVPAAIAIARSAPRLSSAPRTGPNVSNVPNVPNVPIVPIVPTVPIILLGVWLAGVLASVALHIRGGRRLASGWRSAEPLETPVVRAWLDAWLGRAWSRRVQIRMSDHVRSPLLMGAPGGFSSRILVPRACLALEPARLRMILAHEVSHIQRRDLTWGVVPVITQCLFWFHPLARWCVNEYAQAREEACDAGALRLCDEAPHRYGELLLAFGVDGGPHALTAPSYGSSHAAQLKRRLHMLAHAFRPSAGQRALAAGALIVIGTLALVPVRLVAAPSAREESAPDARSDRNEPAAPATAVAPAARPTSVTAATAPSPAAAPFAYAGSGRSRSSRSSSGFSYSSSGDDDDFTYGYSQGHGVSLSGHFDTSDSDWLENLKRRGLDEYAFFRIDRHTYLVTDADQIDRIREAMRPEMELGRRQGELGAQQGELGGQQGALGAEQGRIGAEMARIDASLASGRASDLRRSELSRRRAELESRMSELGDRMEELGKKQEELGTRQEELGKLQSELGRQQEAASRASRARMIQLARELVRAGRVELLDD